MTLGDMDTMGPLVLCLVLLFYQANATFKGGWESDVTHIAKDYDASSHVLPIYSDKRNEYSTAARVIPLKEYIDVLKSIPVFQDESYNKRLWQNTPFLKGDPSHSSQIDVLKQASTVKRTPVLKHVSVIEKVPLKLLHTFDDTSHGYSLSKHFPTLQTQPKDNKYIYGGGVTTESGTGKIPYGIVHDVQFDDDTLDHTPATEFRSSEIFNKEEVGHDHLLEIEPKSQIGSIELFKQSDISSDEDYGTISPLILNKKYTSSKGFRYRYPISNYPYNYGKFSAGYRSLPNKKNCGQAWIPLNKYGQRTYGHYGSSYQSNNNGQYKRLVGSYHELTNPGYKLHEEYAQHNFPEVDIRLVDPRLISHHNKLSNSYRKHTVVVKEFHDGGDHHPLRYNHNTDLSSEEDDDEDTEDHTSHEYQDDHLTDDNDDTTLVKERENVHSRQHHFLDKGHLVHKHEDSRLKNEHEDGHVIHTIEDKHAVSEHPVRHHLIHEFKGEHLVPEHQADHHLFHDFKDKHAVPERPVDHHLIHDFKHKDEHVVSEHQVDHHLNHDFKHIDKHVVPEHPVDHHLIHDFKHKDEHVVPERPVDHHQIHDFKHKDEHVVSEHQVDHHLNHDFKHIDKHVVPERPVDHHQIHDFKHKDEHAVPEHPVDHHIVHDFKHKDEQVVPEHPVDHHLIHDFKNKHKNVISEHPVPHHHLIQNFKNDHAVSEHPVDHQPIHDLKFKHHNNHKEYYADFTHKHRDYDYNDQRSHFHTHDHAENNFDKKSHPSEYEQSEHESDSHDNHKNYKPHAEDRSRESHQIKHPEYTSSHNSANQPGYRQYEEQKQIDNDYYNQHDKGKNLQNNHKQLYEEHTPSHNSANQPGYRQYEEQKHIDNDYNNQHDKGKNFQNNHKQLYEKPTPSHNSANQPGYRQYEEQKQIDNDYNNQHDKGKNLQNNHKQLYEETYKGNYEQKLEKPDRSHNKGYQDRGERKQHSTSTKGQILYYYFRKYHGKRFSNQGQSKVEEVPQAPYSQKTYEEKVRAPQVNDRKPENYNVPQLREGHKDRNTNYGDRIKLKEYKKPALTTSNQQKFNLYQYENENEKTNPKYDTKIDLTSFDAPKQPYRPQYNTDNTPQGHRTRESNYGNNHGAPKTGGIQNQYFIKYHQGGGSRNYGGEYSTQRNPHIQNAGNYGIQPQLSSQSGKQPSSLNSNVQPGHRQIFENPNSEQYSITSQTGEYKADKGFPQQSKSSYYGRDYSDTQKIHQNDYKSTGQFRPVATDAKAYGKDSSESSVGNKRGVKESYFHKYHQGLGAPIHGGHIKPMTSGDGTSHNLQNNFMSELPLSILKKIPKSYTPAEQKEYDEEDDKENSEDLSYSNGPLTKTGYETNQHHSPHHRQNYQDSHPQNGHKSKQKNQYIYPVSATLPVQQKYDDLDSSEFDSNEGRGLISNYFRKYHLGLGAHIHGGNYGDSENLKTSSNARKKA